MISVFFYGAFMDEAVRREHGWAPRAAEVARLDGFELRIDPLSRLVPREGTAAYGIVCSATQDELDTLYSAEWMESYAPRATRATLRSGDVRDVTVYTPPGPVVTATAPTGYAQRLIEIARHHEFPAWYCAHIAAHGRE